MNTIKHISVLIKPASGLCNIRCQYCFYADVTSLRKVKSYGRMTLDTLEKMIAQLFIDLVDGDELTIAFQGGEPTIAGIAYYENLTSLVTEYREKVKVKVHYAIQTNGMTINDRWCQFFKKHDFLVGLSIDGHPLYHDLHRLDANNRGTFKRVMKTKHLFDDYQIEYNILCVLTNQLAKEPKKVYQFLQKEKIKYVQFIPCLDELKPKKKSSYCLTPERFFSFYSKLFELWLAEFRQNDYRSIKLFDDLFNLFVAQKVTACGIIGNCQIQYVIEADGSVYPCDFYGLDEYRLGFIQEKSLRELFEQDISKLFICEKSARPRFCQSCYFVQACGGGCKRMKNAIYVSEKKDFCGYQSLLKTFIPKIEEIIMIREKMKQ